MYPHIKPIILILAATCSVVSISRAATLTDDVVYETVAVFSGATLTNHTFEISRAGTYHATLTDFRFPKPLAHASLSIADDRVALARLDEPGSVFFDGGPGLYSVDLSATADAGFIEQEKSRLRAAILQERKQRGNAWWRRLSPERKAAKKALWASWTKEDKAARRKQNLAQIARAVDQRLETSALGQYGIQIARVAVAPASLVGVRIDASPVPLPPVFQLFGSGLLALAGVSRRK